MFAIFDQIILKSRLFWNIPSDTAVCAVSLVPVAGGELSAQCGYFFLWALALRLLHVVGVSNLFSPIWSVRLSV